MENWGLGSWPRRRARIAPGDPAIVYEGQTWTYGQLDERVNRLANALIGLGVGARDRVGFLGPNHPAFVETMFATCAAGGVFVPLNVRLAAAELAEVVGEAEVAVLVVTPGLAPLAADLVERAPVRHVVVAGSEPVGDYAPLERLVAGGSAHPPHVPIGFDDIAMIMYTSGTTGQLKGVTLSHANLAWNVYNVMIDVDIARDEVSLINAPMFHTAALNQTFLPTFIKGGTAVLMSAFDPQQTLKLIAEYRVTWMFGVPTMFQALTQAPGWESADLSSIRALTAGGAPVPDTLIRTYQARGLTFMQGYGMTEASPGVLFLQARESQRKAGTAGTPCFFTDAEVVDHTGKPVPPGERGEIRCRGPHVMQGYWNKPDLTRSVLGEDGWLRSGDVAIQDEDGFFTIVDRVKDMFISGGENVYPAEIENALSGHPAVADCAVIGVPDQRWGEVGQVFVVLLPGRSLTFDDMVQYLQDRLARYKIPKSLTLVDGLPRSAAGKLLKKQLKNPRV
ncbi:long-chain-fatty-acid--CoA ligase [Phytoactinopolyspora sp. XMNu-373]|uniref:Long-chain-fatty-acid--CoA ligase n=1 Tax=Phytoactinopolyspora mesophila TaxID=2650750 RepID=A0A7K3LX19_9ACTN|nr:long-chain-fatty-acid--CoA ligase [Phytoactinopolyspora mesophila]